jgi:ABC-type polysaccharide/polyol phosphate export permease
MNGLAYQLAVSLRLHFRNRMALIYSYIFPTIFLVAFWVLYRYETPPIVRHMGELLTVTILGGACFGLPTSMVSDRERGVWRRFRLTPVPTFNIVASTVFARYLLLLTAGLVQLALAMLIGMPAPRHPFELFVAFTCVSFAFLGLGLVIATMADNVPAVQALGQCIFLPMLIIGGVAVPLESLPDWAQHVAAFFPGRYAVEALRATVMGAGLGAAGFSIGALLLIGAAGCLAGGRLFRWDAQQRFATLAGKGWVAVAIVAWIAVGLAAETQKRTVVSTGARTTQPAPTPQPVTPAPVAPPTTTASGAPHVPLVATPTEAERAASRARPSASAGTSQPTGTAVPSTGTRGNTARTDTPAAPITPGSRPATGAAESTPPSAPVAVPGAPVAPPSAPAAPAEPALPDWRKTTAQDIDREIDFTRLPPDSGIVTPIAPVEEQPEPEVAQELDQVHARLPAWPPGKDPDIVQRVRNLLYVAAVPDVLQTPIERFAPLEIYDRLEQDIPREQLIQALFWVALHPMDGDDSAIGQLPILGLNYGGVNVEETRNRAAFYAVKLLGRLTGRIVVGK